jgi:7-keto-8-aminopelargonate synthetase-like enzyme
MRTFHFSSSFVYSSEFSPKGVAYTRTNSEHENEGEMRRDSLNSMFHLMTLKMRATA